MKIAYDAVLKKPGCVLIQAVMGGDIPDFAALFPSESWLLAPTPDMKLYTVTEKQLTYLSAMANKHEHERSTTKDV